jgi:hypothetical protein
MNVEIKRKNRKIEGKTEYCGRQKNAYESRGIGFLYSYLVSDFKRTCSQPSASSYSFSILSSWSSTA